MCMGKGAWCAKVGLKRGPWTLEEDMRLIAHIHNYGCANWRALPMLAGLVRCGKSCRLRWINYLRPDLKRGNFTAKEQETIIKLHAILGNKWSRIASWLPGRTDNEIKNVWNTHLKKLAAATPTPIQGTKKTNCSHVSSSMTNKKTNKEEEEAELDKTIEIIPMLDIDLDGSMLLDTTPETHRAPTSSQPEPRPVCNQLPGIDMVPELWSIMDSSEGAYTGTTTQAPWNNAGKDASAAMVVHDGEDRWLELEDDLQRELGLWGGIIDYLYQQDTHPHGQSPSATLHDDTLKS